MGVTRLVPPRIGSVRHRDWPTLGPLLADVARGLGFKLHAWQRLVGDVSLELVPRRGPGSRLRLAAGTVGCVVGRQSGKTLMAASRVILQCALPDMPKAARAVDVDRIRPQHVAYLAQDRAAALARWREHVELLMASPWAELVDRPVVQRGEEAVRFRNGSSYRIVTPSRTGARGLALDLVVIDEAMAHDAELLSAVTPTTAQRDTALGCIGAQLYILSSAGDIRSTLLASQRELGRRAALEGDTSRVWFEWSCPDDADVFDEAVWKATIPTLGARDGIALEHVRMAAETLGAERFALEYLCRAASRGLTSAIDPAVWDALPDIVLPETAEVVVGVDADRDRTVAAVVVAGRVEDVDGCVFVAVELVAHRPGVDWVLGFVADLVALNPAPVVIDAYGPLSSLVSRLERLPGVELRPVRVGEVVDAAAGLCDLVTSGRLAHGVDDRLTDAVASAGKRRVGDRWAFNRAGGPDISPLVATSLAVWAVDTDVLPQPMIW